MAKKPKPGDEAALQTLRDRLLATIDFVQSTQDFPSGNELRQLVEVTSAQGDLRGLRLIAREMEMATIGLAPHERDGLQAVLKARFGSDADTERIALSRHAAVALQRGRIASEKERRRLEDYAELLEATGENPAEADAIRRLLGSG